LLTPFCHQGELFLELLYFVYPSKVRRMMQLLRNALRGLSDGLDEEPGILWLSVGVEEDRKLPHVLYVVFMHFVRKYVIEAFGLDLFIDVVNQPLY
jgi:hypothetical protein